MLQTKSATGGELFLIKNWYYISKIDNYYDALLKGFIPIQCPYIKVNRYITLFFISPTAP
ncbi:MAG: hypothetical protein SGJ10_01980 [Bacteroidota bacterium]|nr:hypothetical protein [Bacteroidota bacterium]